MTEIRPSMAYTVALFLICAAPAPLKASRKPYPGTSPMTR